MERLRYEQRFTGKDNAGLREKIRDVVRDAPDPRAAVLSLLGTVALSAHGEAILQLVADDYAGD